MPRGERLRTDYIYNMGQQYQPMAPQMNALAIRGQEQALRAGDQEYQQRQQVFPMEMQAAREELERAQFKTEDEALDFLLTVGAKIPYADYPKFRQAMLLRGLNESLLPPPERFGSEQEFNAWRDQGIMSLQQMRGKGKATEKMWKVKPGEVIIDQDGNVIYESKKDKGEKYYTLSAGQRLIDAEGNVIAEGPQKTSKKETPEEAAAKTTAREEAKAKVKDTPRQRRAIIKKEFKDKLDKARSAQRGVGQFIEDENKVAVYNAYMAEAANAIRRYVDEGGDIKDLNIKAIDFAEFIYNSPEQVRADYIAGEITRAESQEILKKMWPGQFPD